MKRMFHTSEHRGSVCSIAALKQGESTMFEVYFAFGEDSQHRGRSGVLVPE